MAILLYGMNHTSAPVELRERVAVPASDLSGAVGRLIRFDGVEEGFILSTCNRTEVLVQASQEHAGDSLRKFMLGERNI